MRVRIEFRFDFVQLESGNRHANEARGLDYLPLELVGSLLLQLIFGSYFCVVRFLLLQVLGELVRTRLVGSIGEFSIPFVLFDALTQLIVLDREIVELRFEHGLHFLLGGLGQALVEHVFVHDVRTRETPYLKLLDHGMDLLVLDDFALQ